MSALNSCVFVIGVVVAVVSGNLANAQAQTDRTVEQYTCKEVMHEGGEARSVAIAFLHGYLLGKSGSSKFSVETLQKQTDAFINYCLDNPKDSAEQAMAKLKK